MAIRTVRPRRGRRMLVVGSVVVTAGGLVAGCGVKAADDTTPDHRAFALHGTTLTVDSDDSALELVPVDGDQVRVTRWFKGKVMFGGAPKATWTWHDDHLTLRMSCSGVGFADCSAKHRVEVPRNAAVTVRTRDGSVTARGFRTALTMRSGDGSIKVTDSSGALDLHSSDGSVHASGITARTVRATSGDGSIKLELSRVPDRVSTHSADGSTTITLPRTGPDGSSLAYRVSTRTGDGGVDVRVPRDDASPHVVSAEAGDGNVTVRSAN